MIDVVVVGAGGLGREIIDCLSALEDRHEARCVGVLDDNVTAQSVCDVPVLGPVDAANIPPSADAIVAIGDPEIRLRLVERLGPDASFVNVVHPSAVVSRRAQLGVGIFVAPGAYVGTGSRVGSHSVLNIHSSVGHDATLGVFAVLSPYATLNGHSRVGRGCFLGTNAVVSVNVGVGDWSKLSAGAIANRNLQPGMLAAGNPAKGRVMFRSPEPTPGAV